MYERNSDYEFDFRILLLHQLRWTQHRLLLKITNNGNFVFEKLTNSVLM